MAVTVKTILVSEFGMNHKGTIDSAKEMIRISKECGATMAKGQAFKSCDVKGSMPQGFYDERELTVFELTDLVLYGDEIGIPVFFSVFSREFEPIHAVQPWQKFAASQSKNTPKMVERWDHEKTIVSVNAGIRLPNLSRSKILYASSYLANNPGLENIEFLTEYYGRQVGYSDHTKGIDWCLLANQEFGATVIEKHFTLTRDIYFEGKQFRDAVHSALPGEMELLAKQLI